MKVKARNIPEELKQRPQWVCWVEDSERGKVPIDPKTLRAARSNDRETWASFEKAFGAYEKHEHLNGIGYVFSDDDEYCGIDLDKCVNSFEDAVEIPLVKELDSYTELSPSGEGLHILVKARLPKGKGFKNNGIEIYDRGRYFTVTGNVIGVSEYIEDRQNVVDGLLEEHGRNNESTPDGGNPPGWQDEILKGLDQPGRHDAALRLAARWVNKKLSDFEIAHAIVTWNQKNHPAKETLSDLNSEEITNIIRWVRGQERNQAKVQPRPTTEKTFNEKELLNVLADGARGDAYLFQERYKGERLYDKSRKDWYRFNGQHWERDTLDQVLVDVDSISKDWKKLTQISANRAAVSKGNGQDDEAKKQEAIAATAMNHIKALKRLSYTKEVLDFASSGDDGIGIEGNEWDRDSYLLGVKNGVLDLRTGELRDGLPNDFIKIVAPTEWKALKEPAQKFRQFLSEIFADDSKVIEFVQRLFGYAIAGLTVEHIFPMLFGPMGRNGKGTFLETIKFVLGPYTRPLEAENFMLKTYTSGSGAPRHDIVEAQGVRVTWFSETQEGRALDVSKVKYWVGGDTRTGRAPYAKHSVTYNPTDTLFMLTNHKPRVGEDEAFWQRAILIPFSQRFLDRPNPDDPNEHKKDRYMGEKLKKEAPGILAWMVCGFMQWNKSGLEIPEKLIAATDEYRESEDIISHFIDECCMLGSSYKVRPGKLYEAYAEWARNNGLGVLSNTRFSPKMELKGFEKGPISGKQYFKGIGLASEEEIPF